MSLKSFSLRIDEETLRKLHVIADYEERTVSGQIQILIRNCIGQYEKRFGTIDSKDVDE